MIRLRTWIVYNDVNINNGCVSRRERKVPRRNICWGAFNMAGVSRRSHKYMK